MSRFISEDDLRTFEGWLAYQAVDPTTLTPDELAQWRTAFDEATEHREASRKVGRMKLQPRPGEYRYAVAVRQRDRLWLVFWVRRSPKGEFFLFQPRGDRDWNPHTSYHLDGMLHLKSRGGVMLPPQRRQPLTGSFRGVEHLGAYGGHGLEAVGAICDPEDFTGVFEVAPGVLGPRDGTITVDLVEPGCEPVASPEVEATRRTFPDVNPNVVVRIFF
jgi:hypothetical protein